MCKIENVLTEFSNLNAEITVDYYNASSQTLNYISHQRLARNSTGNLLSSSWPPQCLSQLRLSFYCRTLEGHYNTRIVMILDRIVMILAKVIGRAKKASLKN